MRRVVFIINISVFALALIKCTGSRKASSASSRDAELLAAGQKRYPDLTSVQLKEGEIIYNQPCVRCHSAKPIEKYSEESWGKIMTVMAKKSKLTDEQKETVTRYVIANLEAAKK